MTKDKTYEPFEGFKLLTEMWERQLNGLLYMMADNKEFVRTAKIGLDAHSRYMELLKRNRDFVAGVMNIPTKNDVAKVAKLSIQAEEKIDGLEEQIWELKKQVSSLNDENLAFFQEMITMVKQFKEEMQKAAEEVLETKRLHTEVQELRQAIIEMRITQVNLKELQKEVEDLKGFQLKQNKMDLNEMKLLQTEIQELKHGVGQFSEIKKEISALKTLVKKEKELVLADTGGTSK